MESQTMCDDDNALDQTFEVNNGDTHDGTPLMDEVRVVVDDDAEPGTANELDVTIHIRGARFNGSFEPRYPEVGVANRDEGEYVVMLDKPAWHTKTRKGDYIMGGATGVSIPDAVGDRICEHFDIDTISERADDVATRSVISQLRARIEYGDDTELREEVETILEQTK